MYHRIVEDVIQNLHTTFEEDGVDQQTLDDMKAVRIFHSAPSRSCSLISHPHCKTCGSVMSYGLNSDLALMVDIFPFVRLGGEYCWSFGGFGDCFDSVLCVSAPARLCVLGALSDVLFYAGDNATTPCSLVALSVYDLFLIY